LELIAEKAWWEFDNPSNLTTDGSDTITEDEFGGYRLEVAYHIPHGDNTLTPFIRYEEMDDSVSSTQKEDEFLTIGAMYKFGDNWEVKATYEQFEDASLGKDIDQLQFSVGLQF
jgi:hypothetical protein